MINFTSSSTLFLFLLLLILLLQSLLTLTYSIDNTDGDYTDRIEYPSPVLQPTELSKHNIHIQALAIPTRQPVDISPTRAPIAPLPTRVPTVPQPKTDLPTVEYNALEDFYTATNGGDWRGKYDTRKGEPWNFVNPLKNNPCTDNWAGVTCDCTIEACHVVKLNLTHHNVSGHLPDSIGGLSFLEEMDLSHNNIGLHLPVSLAMMSNISKLSLSGNQFSGSLPEALFSNFSRIEMLDLSVNKINGYLPLSLFNLTTLKGFDIGVNSVHGTIPKEILKWNQTMHRLALNRNNFYGPVLDLMAEMTALRALYLHNNRFTGTFPIALGNIENLVELDLSNNRFTGSFPSGFNNTWSELRLFAASVNLLTGHLPDNFLANSHNINQVKFSSNLLSGTLPNSFVFSDSLQSVAVLALDYNRFTGSFPKGSFSQLPVLESLLLDGNLFTGHIVDLLTSMISLHYVTFSDNQFSGPLPNMSLPSANSLIGGNNYFTGTIPTAIENSKYLLYFAFGNNAISGSLPQWLCNLHVLQFFQVDFNMLTGTFPSNFSRFNAFQVIKLNDNHLTSSLPLSIVYLEHLTQLYIQNNHFTGRLPEGVLRLERIQILYAQNNRFTGPLLVEGTSLTDDEVFPSPLPPKPPAPPVPTPTLPFLGDIGTIGTDDGTNGTVPTFLYAALINIDVSNNLLSGTIPKQFFTAAPNLRAYVLSSNCFSGNIPETICAATELTSIVLDGMGSAVGCNKPLLPGVPFLSQFHTTSAIYGTIPPCIFQLPQLQTLHLSGNGLSGTLPVAVNISSAIQVLSLAHNSLSGSIPLAIQRRHWNTLDLSFNKFNGILDSEFHDIAKNASVSLNINRLSGDIPAPFLVAPSRSGNISMLEGNIFYCESDLGTGNNEGLPTQDPDYSIYSCGSDSVNKSFFIWFVVACVVIACVIVWISIVYSTSGSSTSASSTVLKSPGACVATTAIPGHQNVEREGDKGKALTSILPQAEREVVVVKGLEEEVRQLVCMYRDQWWWKEWMEDVLIWIRIVSDIRIDDRIVIVDAKEGEWGIEKKESKDEEREKAKYGAKDQLPAFVSFLQSIRRVFFLAAMFGVCCLMPVYYVLTVTLDGGTYAHEYAWTYSAILLSGLVPGMVLIVCFVLTLSFVIYLFYKFFHSFSLSLSSNITSHTKKQKGREKTSSDENQAFPHEVAGIGLPSVGAAKVLSGQEVGGEDNERERDNEKSIPPTPQYKEPFVSHLRTSFLRILCWWRPEEKNKNGEREGETEEEAKQRRRDHRVTTYSIAFFNLALMILVDIGYVIIILRSSGYVVFLTQFCLSIFKQCWNEIILWNSIPFFRNYLYRPLLKKFVPCCYSLKSKKKRERDGAAGGEGEGEGEIEGETEEEEVDEVYIKWQQRLASLSISPSKYRFNEDEISFILLTVLLNNVVIPCLSIAIVSSDCYYDAFFPSPPTSTYTLYTCAYTTSVFFHQTCVGETSYTETSTYDPPFAYRHQCSAAFAINYTAVFVYKFMNIGLVAPAIKLMMKISYRKPIVLSDKFERVDKDGTNRTAAIQETRQEIFPGSKSLLSLRIHNGGNPVGTEERIGEIAERESLSSTCSAQRVYCRSMTVASKIFYSLMHSLNSYIDETINPRFYYYDCGSEEEPDMEHVRENNMTKDRGMNDAIRDRDKVRETGKNDIRAKRISTSSANEKAVFFKRYKFVVRMNSYMAILLTFGIIFHPLAVIICLAVFSCTWYEHLVMGRVLLMTKQQQRQEEKERKAAIEEGRVGMKVGSTPPYYAIIRRQLSKEVADIGKYFFATLWYLIAFGSLAYAFILYDTFGNQYGWRAIIPACLMAGIPLVLYLVVRGYIELRRYHYLASANKRQVDDEHSKGIELQHIISPLSQERG